MKVSKRQRAIHNQAMELLNLNSLSWEEQQTFYEMYNEAASYDVSASGAFFTPPDLALDFGLEVCCEVKEETILDLCAGIGVLSWACLTRNPKSKITAIEQNPEWVKIGRKLLPQVNWICADISDLNLRELGYFDKVISNPPYGVVPTLKQLKCPRYEGSQAHYKILDIASCMGSRGVFLLPQSASSFSYSNVSCFTQNENKLLKDFGQQTSIEMTFNMGIDTSCYSGFKNTTITTEIVCCDFDEHEWPEDAETILVASISERPIVETPRVERVIASSKPRIKQVEVDELQFSLAF